jgi:hypothetical protein
MATKKGKGKLPVKKTAPKQKKAKKADKGFFDKLTGE